MAPWCAGKFLFTLLFLLEATEMLRRASSSVLRSCGAFRARAQLQASASLSGAAAGVVNKSNVKIVATIGPASEHMPKLQHVVDAGLKIMRINFSHGPFTNAFIFST
jgi:hypothetical protein